MLFQASFSNIPTRSLYIHFQAVSDVVLIVDARRIELTNRALFGAISYSDDRLKWRILRAMTITFAGLIWFGDSD